MAEIRHEQKSSCSCSKSEQRLKREKMKIRPKSLLDLRSEWKVSLLILSSLLFISSLVKASDTEGLFTANRDLVDLLLTEAELVKGLKEYIKTEEERIVKLKE